MEHRGNKGKQEDGCKLLLDALIGVSRNDGLPN
jgi:hypothetical protein